VIRSIVCGVCLTSCAVTLTTAEWKVEPPPAACEVVLTSGKEWKKTARFDAAGKLLFRQSDRVNHILTEQYTYSGDRLITFERFVDQPDLGDNMVLESTSREPLTDRGERQIQTFSLRYDGARVVGWSDHLQEFVDGKRTSSKLEQVTLRYQGDQLIEVLNGEAVTRRYSYRDGLRVKERVGGDVLPEDAEIEYENGRVVSVVRPFNKMSFSWDDAGRLLRWEHTRDGVLIVDQWERDANGRIVTAHDLFWRYDVPTHYEYAPDGKVLRAIPVALKERESFGPYGLEPITYAYGQGCGAVPIGPVEPDVRMLANIGPCIWSSHQHIVRCF
jgi:YD repeat-containing protein